MRITITFFLMLLQFECLSQINTDTIYLVKSDEMFIEDYRDSLEENRIKLEFSVFSKSDDRNMLYGFEFYNIDKDFKNNKLEDIGKEIDINTIKDKIYHHKDLVNYSSCDLLLLLADTPNIYLLIKKEDSYKKYLLQYQYTSRGWNVERYNHH